MKAFFGWVFAGLGVIVVMTGIGWAVAGNDFLLYKYFAPKQEAVRREVFEQSKAYNQGMIQELQDMMFQYAGAAPEQRAGLASIILHRSADYDMDKLPPDLSVFVQRLRNERMNR